MKIVVATLKYNGRGQCNTAFEEIEFDGNINSLADILDVTEYKPEVEFNDGSGGGCPSTSIEIGKNYTMSSICEEGVYPIAFILDGIYFFGEIKIALYGIENMIGVAPVYTLADIEKKLEYFDYSKE